MEVNGSPVRQNLGIFFGKPLYVQRFALLRNLCTKNPILMERTLIERNPTLVSYLLCSLIKNRVFTRGPPAKDLY